MVAAREDAQRRKVLEDIVSLWIEGTDEQRSSVVDAFIQESELNYRNMMADLERQCDKYKSSVGATYLQEYGLASKDPKQLRRYFIVRNYILPICDSNEGAISMAARRIATMNPEEYAYAIQALRSANESPNGGDQARTVLEEIGKLSFTPIQQLAPQRRMGYYGNEVQDPVAAERARRGREYAFAALHHGVPETYRR